LSSIWKSRRTAIVAASVAAAGALAIATAPGWSASGSTNQAATVAASDAIPASLTKTTTPIKHVVVLFDENVSFDHYFGTYPNAANTDGTKFTAQPGTPKVNGLTKTLLTNNPNAYDPKRLAHSQALTCDQDHNYSHEQKAVNGGKMDKFVENTEADHCTGQPILFGEPGLVMDYYDGNTVTGLWNYAQHYAMSDNSWATGFGPSTPGAINLIAGNTHGGVGVDPITGQPVSGVVASPDGNGVGTVIGDPDPAYDDCSDNNHTSKNGLLSMGGKNVGDLLNDKGVTWGWFQGGFKPTGTANGYSVCGATHQNIGGNTVTDYSPHHNPFSYYKSTANPKHLPPSSVANIGRTDQANHNYDLTDFDAALKAGNMPAVSFLKAAASQDGHPGNSDPLDEQQFIVNTINKIQQSPEWNSTAIFIAYDDSDGWYDHVAPKITNGSQDPAQDTAATCGTAPAVKGYQDRCGPSQRLPFLAISPYSKVNFVDHHESNQTSITNFIENNWQLSQIGDGSFDRSAGSLNSLFNFGEAKAGKLNLNPVTGAKS
jgi:phospholipase C